MIFLIAYIATTLTFLAIDAIWLGVVAKNFYFSRLEHLMASDVKLHLAALFYLTYMAGLVFLAIKPALENNSVSTALIHGAVLGFMAYGTYNFTNMSTLRDWPIMVSVVDISWGTILSATTAGIGYWVTTKFATGS